MLNLYTFRYMPVRSDSVVGELKLSAATDMIFPGKLSFMKKLELFLCLECT